MVGFTEITNEYRQKHYPNGYFTSIAQNSNGAILVVCGVILALMGVGAGILPVYATVKIITGTLDFKIDASVIIFFYILALVFLIPGIMLARYGVKRAKMGKDDWIKICAEASDYPESVVLEFDSQIMRTDAVVIQLDPSGTTDIMTTDFLLWGNLIAPLLIKVDDIDGAYLVLRPDTINVNGKIKKIVTLNLAVISNHNTHMIMPTREDLGRLLISRLLEKNPNIKTSEEMLNEEQYQAMV